MTKKKLIVVFTVIAYLTFIARVWFFNNSKTLSPAVTILTNKIQDYKNENLLLENEVLYYMSYSYISARAIEKGYRAGEYINLK